MKIFVPETLKNLAECLTSPLYIVGGYVRNFLIDGTVSKDLDIAAAMSVEELAFAAENCGFKIVAEYKRTGTVVVFDGKRKYEYTRFRTDSYGTGGKHTPLYTEFTDDICKDARRRDFTCNAVYYDIKNGVFVDPLDGIKDIKNKVLKTVKSPEEVFCSDGLRLMRLARFAGELGFTPCADVINNARLYANNIKDIAPERVYDELKKILLSDGAYTFSDKAGHYTGVKILEETGVFDALFPEIAAGRGMVQRADFHKYDVLEHSLRTLSYTEERSVALRLAALLHDAGKPYQKNNYGTFKGHAEIGAEIAGNILKRLKVDNRTASDVVFLVKRHMFDLKCNEDESAVRRFIVENGVRRVEMLLRLKSADCLAGNGSQYCPTVEKWTKILGKMREDGTPFTIKDLKITAAELIETGFCGKTVGEELKRLFSLTVAYPHFNDAKKLKEKAEKDFKELI
ncbi:MAG: CCA tRNA nucleotidyltransferase [Clostridia bacterium]|nr:CCA tRNA nucleotidyltransferase [Clostridia bacterium]